MEKLQFYKYAALGLLLLNLSMIAFFFLTKPPHGKMGEGKVMRANQRLHLDNAQHQLFLAYSDKHIQKMKAISEQQKVLLKPYFHTLVDTTQNIDIQKIMSEVKELEGQKIVSVYEHFQEVKSILKPEQYVYFEPFVDNLFKRILDGKKRPKRPKDF